MSARPANLPQIFKPLNINDAVKAERDNGDLSASKLTDERLYVTLIYAILVSLSLSLSLSIFLSFSPLLPERGEIKFMTN